MHISKEIVQFFFTQRRKNVLEIREGKEAPINALIYEIASVFLEGG